MMIRYDCTADISDLTLSDKIAIEDKLKGYDYYVEGDRLIISGECEVTNWDEEDVAADLEWRLADLDVDVHTQSDSQPEKADCTWYDCNTDWQSW